MVEFIANPNLVNKQAAQSAYRGTSFEPEKRAEQAIQGFVSEVQSMYDRLKPYATSEAQKVTLISEMERFEASYAQKYNDLLYSHSRLYSTMIAGPSKFPTERMHKLNDAYDKKAGEVHAWKDRAEKSILRTLRGEAIEEAGGEVEVLKKKIADAERNHEFMVKANVVVRKKIPDDQKIREIMALGTISETTAREILKPDVMGRVGFPAYALSNDIANISRMKQRLTELENKEATPTGEISFEGGTIIDSREIDRVQIIFNDKPPQEMINKLKSEGWRFSPSNVAWQRKRTSAALYSAARITGATLPTTQAAPTPVVITPQPPPVSQTDKIISLARLRASEWFKEQVSNPYERFYLYHRVGDFRISNVEPIGYILSNTERIPTSWTVEQATQWIITTVQRLPILPLEAVPAGAPVAQPPAPSRPIPTPIEIERVKLFLVALRKYNTLEELVQQEASVKRLAQQVPDTAEELMDTYQQRYEELSKKYQGTKKMYRYYYRNRPPDIGTQPAGFIRTETWLPIRTTPHGRTAFGWVEYDRPLTQEEISGYELFEDEPVLPKLVSELVEFARVEGIDEAMKEVDSEYGRAVWGWLQSQNRIRAGVGQKEQIRDEIMRLAGISEVPAPATKSISAPIIAPIPAPAPTNLFEQTADRIRSAQSTEELERIRSESKTLPLFANDRIKLLELYNARYAILQSEKPFGVPIQRAPAKPTVLGVTTEEERRRKAQQKLTAPATTRLSRFGVEERAGRYYPVQRRW